MRNARVLLVAENDDWADTVTRFFSLRGHEVTRARTASSALVMGAESPPDAVLIEHELKGSPGDEVCRSIGEAPWSDATTPIVLRTAQDLEAGQRVQSLRAGAWDVVSSSADPEEILARLERYVAVKQAADRAREEGLVDRVTGLYNDRGLARRCEELVAEAFRRHAALACLAVAPDLSGAPAPGDSRARSAATMLVHALHGVRRSDVIGRQAADQFVILAPRTDALGAAGLARRLTNVVAMRLHVGYDAIPNVRERQTSPGVLIHAALEALRRVSVAGAGAPTIQPYRPFEHRRPTWS